METESNTLDSYLDKLELAWFQKYGQYDTFSPMDYDFTEGCYYENNSIEESIKRYELLQLKNPKIYGTIKKEVSKCDNAYGDKGCWCMDNNEKCLPVIGWRKTFCSKSNQKNVLAKFLNKKDFYYLHSYQVLPKNKDDIICYYERGGSKINAAITAGNIWGVQFHPEKSGEAGLEFLKAFSNLKINY